ncbi:MAG: CCA tRNA nucleotidyltransferase [Planctomycetes bacterium]|nr:CCA tRNA nucleotidyltransferase [Planctomycetota bacterium]
MSRKQATLIAARLARAGHRAVFAGGAVRDRLLGRAAADVDVATDATPQEVMALFPRSVPVGEAFGVVKVVTDDGTVDVATFRRDVGLGDGRHPAQVERATLEQDVLRRDFTINGLMEEPEGGEVIDLVGGLDDLRARRVRAIGDPGLRFREDGLRLLRGVRFAAVLGFELEASTASAMREHAAMLRRISGERVRGELERMLVCDERARALELLDEVSLLPEVLPEVASCAAAAHAGEEAARRRWAHALAVLEALGGGGDGGEADVDETSSDDDGAATLARPAGATFPLALAVTLCECAVEPAGAPVETVCARLRCSSAVARRALDLAAARGQLAQLAEAGRATLRRVAASPAYHELALWEDALARAALRPPRLRPAVVALVQSLGREALLPAPFVTGADVLAAGVAPGPRVGELVRAAHDLQLAGELNDREAALAWLRAEA